MHIYPSNLGNRERESGSRKEELIEKLERKFGGRLKALPRGGSQKPK
jgi:hypothetical protein